MGLYELKAYLEAGKLDLAKQHLLTVPFRILKDTQSIDIKPEWIEAIIRDWDKGQVLIVTNSILFGLFVAEKDTSTPEADRIITIPLNDNYYLYILIYDRRG